MIYSEDHAEGMIDVLSLSAVKRAAFLEVGFSRPVSATQLQLVVDWTLLFFNV